jgi:type IV secretion system protein VirB4
MNTRRGPKLITRRRANLLRREHGGGDMLPYARHVDDVTIATRDGLLIQFLYLDGFPFETADSSELNYRQSVRETMLRSIASSHFAVYHHVVRREVTPELDGRFENPFARSLDRKWRERLGTRRLHTNNLFLSIVRRPLQGRAGWMDGFVRTATTNSAVERARAKRELNAASGAFLSSLQPYGVRLLSTYESPHGLRSEPLEFLSCLYNGEFRPLGIPNGDAGRAIPYRRVSFGLDAMELSPAGDADRTFAAMLSVKEYPPHTHAGQLDPLFRQPHELVLTESFAFTDRQTSLDRMNLAIRRMRAADDDAISLRQDLVVAKDDVAAGRSCFGEHHMSIMVKARSLAALNEAVADIQATWTEIGAIVVREDVAMEPAFWAQFPGNFRFIARKALISSGNFAGLASCHNQPVGRATGNPWGPAVTVLESTAASPYYFNFHHGDLGNFLLIGPSGSGKTVILNFLLAQAQKFEPRIVFFDKDRGAEIFLRALGGHYDVLRPGVMTGFNPLQLPDSPANRRFLQQWVARLLTTRGEILTTDDAARVTDAVAANFEQQPAYRRLRFFRELFSGVQRPHAGDLSARLAPWTGQGDQAWLFDNERDLLDLSARTIGFDMTKILDDPVLRTPAMMYLFHRVEERLEGTPTIIVVDEGWKALDDDVFVASIRDWEKTIRKRNGVVGFATQSAGDALSSRISSAIIEQSATQIFLPNPKAQESEYCRGFGLSPHEFDLIRSLPDTSRCFLIRHGKDSVVARLDLDGMSDILAVLSGRERTVRILDELRADLGPNPEQWLAPLMARAG